MEIPERRARIRSKHQSQNSLPPIRSQWAAFKYEIGRASCRKEKRSLCDWSSDVCSSDLGWPRIIAGSLVWRSLIQLFGLSTWKERPSNPAAQFQNGNT